VASSESALVVQVAKLLIPHKREILLAWKSMMSPVIGERVLAFRKIHLEAFTTLIAGGDFKGWNRYIIAQSAKLKTSHDFMIFGNSLYFCSCLVCLNHVISRYSAKSKCARVRAALEGFVLYNMDLLLKVRNKSNDARTIYRSSLPDLTRRENEILQYILDGWSNKETAVQLGLSVKTVEAHRANFMRKLGIHNVAGLARYVFSSTQGLQNKEDRM
jgi:DNA-binding CsgD family transcriptional regulator